MLSASQGKYELERSSGRIGENINYIYYFTYFHPYSTHPFWDEFKEVIQEKIMEKIKPWLEGLKGSITPLQEKHKALKEILSTYSNPKNLIEKYVKEIEDKITEIDTNLKCYVVEELPKINKQLQSINEKFEKQLKCSCGKLSSEISFVKTTLRITRKITYSVKKSIKILNENGSGSFYYYEIMESSEKCEETKESRTEKRLQRICDYIKKLLPTTNSFPNLSDLTYENFDDHKKMKDIEEYIEKLECAIEYIKEKKRKIENSQNVTTTERSEGKWQKFFGGKSVGLEKEYMEFQVSYQKEITKVENLISVNNTISKLLNDVCCEIDKLEKEITCFKRKLSKVKEQLERLKYIKFLNDELQGHKKLTGQLHKIRGFVKMIEDIKPGTKSTEQIKINLTRFITNKYYYISVNLVKRTVDCLLEKREIKHADSCNPDLVIAKAALKCVQKNLCKLQSIGKMVPDLIKMAPILTELLVLLQKVESVMSTLQIEIEHLGGQLGSTGKELWILLDFKSSVEGVITQMKGNIETITSVVPKIKEQYKQYTEAFAAFKKALEELETCLDYIIKNFLKCSLGTTICILKRQLRDTTWECPDTECNTCQTTTLMTDKVYVLQASLHKYVFSLLGHFSTLDTKVFISKLYRCILRFDDIVDIVQVVDCCKCVKKLQGNNKAGNSNKTVTPDNSNHPKTCMMKYRDYVKKNKETQHIPHTLGDSDNNLYHLCLCLALKYILYPCLLKTVTLLVQLELRVSGNIARKSGTHRGYNSYYKHSSYNSYYTQDSSYNSYNLSVSTMLVLSTWVMIHLASFLEHRYDIKHVKVKCCTEEKAECTCKCNKNGASPPNNCCQCVCDKKRNCECKCKPEEHCFCKKYKDDCFYRWFIYLILYICHLVDHAFTLGYWDIEHAIQLLSNLHSRLDAVCWEPDRRCVTIAVKPSGKPGTAATSSTPTLKVKCCVVCVNLRVVCVSRHVLCVTHLLVKTFNKKDDKDTECKLEDIKCICECKDGTKCLDQLTNLTQIKHNNLKCEVFKGLKDKLDKLTKLPELTNLKNLNENTPKWTLVCDCKPDTPNCLCKDETLKNGEVCKNLKDLSSLKSDEFKCGCESVTQCCCCCKCEECGNGKSRKCNEKGCGHGNGNGHNGTPSPTSQNGQTGQTATTTTTGRVKCPCQKDGKDCCQTKPAPGGKPRTCNCTKDEAKPAPAATSAKPCQCCCLSCCALEKKEDEKKEGEKKEDEKKEGEKKEGEKNCPCKKKKKDKPKVHCKDDDNLKDKRCCCKCRPKENGTTNGGTATTTTTPATPSSTTTNPEKDCCCCCQCKTKCGKQNGGGAGSASGGANGSTGNTSTNTNGKCKCPNGNDNGKPCNCYCCFVCVHEKSALKSVCKQLAYELNSGILVLSKLASNLTIECCEDNQEKLCECWTTVVFAGGCIYKWLCRVST